MTVTPAGIYRHYIFGNFVESPHPLDSAQLEGIFREAAGIREKIAAVPLRAIIEVLDEAGARWGDPSYPGRKEALEAMPALVGFHETMVVRALDALSGLLSRETLEKILTCELKLPESLDRWSNDPLFDGALRAMPRGIVLHVSAGNVFIGGIDSLVHGLLSKNVNLLKCSGADPLFPLLFARTMGEVDKEGLVAGSFSVLTFNAGDRALEEHFKRKCHAIVVWGGEEAVAAYRRDLPLSTKLIEYGPRVGFSLISREGVKASSLDTICQGLAHDVAMWEQRACSSPQTLFIERALATDLFFAALVKAMEHVAERLPQGELTMDEEIEILKARECAVMSAVLGEGKVFFPAGSTSYTLIYEEKPGFRLSPLSRCLYIKPFNDFSEVLEALRPMASKLQTATLSLSPGEFERYSPLLLAAGVSRFTGVGKSSEGHAGGPHEGSYQLASLLSFRSRESAGVPRAPERLSRLVAFARSTSPYYRERLEGVEDFTLFPLLTSRDLFLTTPPRGNDILTGPPDRAYTFASGGSTGEPKFCFYEYEEFDHVGAILARIYEIAGLTRRDLVANLFVAGSLWTSFLAATKALEKMGARSLPIAGNADMELILSYLDIFRPTALIGIPSIIIQIAEMVEKRSTGRLLVEKILYGGEHMSPEVRQYLREVLGTKTIMSAGYASVDAGVIGYQCGYCKGSIHHLLADYAYVEILDPEAGTPLKRGERGEIVVTNLHRRLMPIIRYRTGDAGRLLAGPCPCGREDPLFELLGRCDDVVRVGAMSFYPGEMEPHLAAFGELSHIFQIEARTEGRKEHVRVLVESKSPDVAEHRSMACAIRRAVIEKNTELALVLREGWLGSFVVQIVDPGSIERLSRTGKVRRVVDLENSRYEAMSMFEAYSDEARAAVKEAEDEARKLGHKLVGTEHILLALLRDTDVPVARLLLKCGLNVEIVRCELLTLAGGADILDFGGSLTFDPSARRALEASVEEMVSCGEEWITVEHLFLGITHRGDTLASLLIERRGGARIRLREEVKKLLLERKSRGLLSSPHERAPRHERGDQGEAQNDRDTVRILAEKVQSLEEKVAALSPAASPPLVGIGFDSHRLKKGGELVLGGVKIPFHAGLEGHSDADVLVHAIIDAVLGALGAGDIGTHFPDSDEQYRGISSIVLLARLTPLLVGASLTVVCLDSIILAQEPRLAPYMERMKHEVSRCFPGLAKERVSIKAKTAEGMGFVGEGEGMAAYATAVLAHPALHP
jgi:phenylacetate-CoA ligase